MTISSNFLVLFTFLIHHYFISGDAYAYPDVIDIFILAGQSNMAGRGGVAGGKWDGHVPPESRPNPAVRRLSAQLRWEEAREPLHADIDVGKVCGVGPGMAFANEVVARSGMTEVVGLVPCAVGGTKIGQWARGKRLYGQLVRRGNEAVSASGGNGKIRGVLWYQGESDTISRRDAEDYEMNMKRFISDLRYDLHLPDLLVIQVALASGEGDFIELVRKSQMEVCRSMPNVKCVDAKGMPLKQDHLHLTTTAQVHLGFKLAQAFLNISH